MGQAAPQLSPDGKWWWDGSQWAPAHQAMPRTLLTNYRGGSVLIEGPDVVVAPRRRREERCPLLRAQILHQNNLWSIHTGHGDWHTLREADREAGLEWLLDRQTQLKRGQEAQDIQLAVRAITEGAKVQREFVPTGPGAHVKVEVERGYLSLNWDAARVPLHTFEFASTGADGGEWYVSLVGSGTELGRVRGSATTSKQAADWLNEVFRELRRQQQEMIAHARAQHVPLVRCLYCGTRVQDVGRCMQCGAPLPG